MQIAMIRQETTLLLECQFFPLINNRSLKNEFKGNMYALPVFGNFACVFFSVPKILHIMIVSAQ